jgi:hypothetical protein
LLADFNWERNGSLKSQIYTHLSLWFLGGKAVSVTIEIGDRHYKPHPIPENSRTALGIEECWADELGRLLVLHDDKVENGEYFIGIACAKAFAEPPDKNVPVGNFEHHDCQRFFPLVGQDNCDCRKSTSVLKNAYHHPAPSEYTQSEVSFEAAKKNIHLLGASEVRPPANGSHYKVKFPGAQRSWTLDSNHNPCKERHLKQLEAITGHNYKTIVYTLREGRLPPERLKLED